ncbi:MAG: DNA polymerase III subunit delta [Ruminococcus sp.]|nr:DNA polymerase III subunit delta [Ruminococcus sp.]
MAFVSQTQCASAIRSGKYERLYLFYGRDVGALEPFAKKLTSRLCPKEEQAMNLHRFDAQELDIEAFVDSVQVLPMFSDRVTVTLEGLNMDKITKAQGDILRKIIADIPDTTVIVITAAGESQYKNRRSLTDKNKRFAELCAKHGSVCEFAFKSVSDIAKTIKKQVEREGCVISQHDAQYLAQLCNCETSHVNKELEKLCSYANGSEITREDIDALCVRRIESDGFGLALAILRSNAQLVFERLYELRVQSYEPTQILAIINMSLSDIYRARLCRTAGKSYAECAKEFNYPKNREFAVRNAFNECANIGIERIRRMSMLLSNTEYRLKTRSMNTDDAFLALEQFAAEAMA